MNTHQNSSKCTMVAAMFYTFLLLTVIAAIFNIFGLDWFASTVEIPEPDVVIQKIVKASLKVFELMFIYKILTKRSFLASLIVATFHVFGVGFLDGIYQTITDSVLMLIIPLILRKDRLRVLLDFAIIFVLCNTYGLLMSFAKFSDYEGRYNFYYSIASLIDYKLFIVTLYLYIKYKGGMFRGKLERKESYS